MLLHVLHPVRPHAIRTMQTDQQWQRRPWAGMVFDNFFYPIGFDLEVGTSQTICRTLETLDRLLVFYVRKPICVTVELTPTCWICTTPLDASGLPGGVPTARPRLGIIGRLSEQKGHTDLLDAMLIIRKTVPTELLIIGPGELESDLRQRQRAWAWQIACAFLGAVTTFSISCPALTL